MNDIAKFHTLVNELLGSIGFALGMPEPRQDLFTLVVDDNYTLHIGLLDATTGFALAELPEAVQPDAPLAIWLQKNTFDDALLQPVIALDAFQRPLCHLRFPLADRAGPQLIAAFLGLLGQADMLCRHTQPGKIAPS